MQNLFSVILLSSLILRISRQSLGSLCTASRYLQDQATDQEPKCNPSQPAAAATAKVPAGGGGRTWRMQADFESDQGTILVSTLGAAARRSSHLSVHLPRNADFVHSLSDEVYHVLVADPE